MSYGILASAVAKWKGLPPAAQAAIKETPDYQTTVDAVAQNMANDPDTGREVLGGIDNAARGAIVREFMESPQGFLASLGAGETLSRYAENAPLLLS